MKLLGKCVLFSLLLVLSVCSCQRMVYDQSDIVGTWQEYYDDPAFVMDGTCTWTIGDDAIVLHVYDALSNESHDWSIGYSLEKKDGQLTISLHYPEDFPNDDESFVIVKLNDREMAWQKVGTTFSRGSYSSDYLHFVNDRYWATKSR